MGEALDVVSSYLPKASVLSPYKGEMVTVANNKPLSFLLGGVTFHRSSRRPSKEVTISPTVLLQSRGSLPGH